MLKHVIAASVVLGLLSACTPSAPNAVTPGTNNGTPSAPAAPAAGAFPFKKISYDITTEMMGMTTNSRVSTEVLAVTDADITVKTTVTINGQTNEQTTTSKLHDGAYVPTTNGDGMGAMTKVGSESVSVKAGTFNADKYTYNKDGVEGTYWIAQNLLVKSVTTASQQGVVMKSTMELAERQ